MLASKLRSTLTFSRAESYHPEHSGAIWPEFAFPVAVNNHRQEMLESPSGKYASHGTSPVGAKTWLVEMG